jgi:hypothetical protein
MTAAPLPDLREQLAIVDRQLLLADYLRQWRFREGLTTGMAARRIGGISRSYVEAIEEARYQPAELPPPIMHALMRLAGPLPVGLTYSEPPEDAAAPTAGGIPDGAGDGADPARRSPAPEGPDGPERDRPEDDRLPLVALMLGDVVMIFPDRKLVRVLMPDEAARLGGRLQDLARRARSISTIEP